MAADGRETVLASRAYAGGDLALGAVRVAGHALKQAVEGAGKIRAWRTAARSGATWEASQSTAAAGGDWVAGLTSGSTGHAGAIDHEEAGLADTGLIISGEGVVS